MTNYAKLLENGQIQSPPKKFVSDNEVIFGFSDSPTMMIQHGYYPLEYTEQPDIPDGKMIQNIYTLRQPIATTVTEEVLNEETNETETVERITYDIPNPVIVVTYSLVDVPVEEEMM